MRIKSTLLRICAVFALSLSGCAGTYEPSGGSAAPRYRSASASFTDARTGQPYYTVRIGNATWMAENLNYATDGSWCYDGSEPNCRQYGRLYTYNDAMSVCPSGWRLPDTADWKALAIAVGGVRTYNDRAKFYYYDVGKKLNATSGWNQGMSGTDNFGFSAKPGGIRYATGKFEYRGTFAAWWSSTDSHGDSAYVVAAIGNAVAIGGDGKDNKGAGMSVRCVRDEGAGQPVVAQPASASGGAGTYNHSSGGSVGAGGNTARSEAEQQLLSTGKMVLDAVQFQTGKTDIPANARPYLTIVAKMLSRYPTLKIEVGGHTDNAGRFEENMALSQGMAQAVAMFMISVEPALGNMLVPKGYGPTVPIADNNTDAGREANRRVELRVLNTGALKDAQGQGGGQAVVQAQPSRKEQLEEKIRELERQKELERERRGMAAQSTQSGAFDEAAEGWANARNDGVVDNSILSEGVLLNGVGSRDGNEYTFRPSRDGVVVFRSVGDAGHSLEIAERTSMQRLAESGGSSDTSTAILYMLAEKEYVVSIRSYYSLEKFSLSAELLPDTYNAGDSDFSVTLASDNKTCVITKYNGPSYVRKLVIPATIQGVPVSKIGVFAFSSESHYKRRTDSYYYGTVYNRGIVEVVIPEGVKIIDGGAFFSNAMFNVTIPSSITHIGGSAFDACSNLREVTLPNKSIEYYAMIFQRTGLTDIKFPPTMKTIPEGFLARTKLKSLIIPEGVTEIGALAFERCDSLTNVTLPSTLKKIGAAAFRECPLLAEITFPRGLASIGAEAFHGCKMLSSIVIPEGITTISANTFSRCDSLKSVSLPTTIKTIEKEAFAECKQLKEFHVPQKVAKITWGGSFYAASSFYDSGTDERPFRRIVLPLAIQARLRELGYQYKFD